MNAGRPATLLDLVSAIMDRPTQPMDFAIVAHLGDDAPDRDSLQAAAVSARRAFPLSGARLVDKRWIATGDETAAIGDEPAHTLLSERFDPALGPPVRQSLNDGVLTTRFHHAACDGRSAIRWLDHQLTVAAGLRDPMVDAGAWDPPALRAHKAPMRKQRHAHRGASARLVRPEGGARSGRRGWRTWSVPRAKTTDLAEASLAAAARWNAAHRGDSERVALWFPMDIRARRDEGFGNGSSRIRVYRQGPPVSRQVRAAFSDGEWAVAGADRLERLPRWLLKAVMRTLSWAPWLDMATLPFTHLERVDALPGLGQVRSVEAVGLLDRRHPLGVIAASHGDQTSVTVTWDLGELSETEVSDWFGLMREALA